MRIKKKYFPILLLVLCGIINSCSREEIENNQIEVSQIFLLKNNYNAIVEDEKFLSIT